MLLTTKDEILLSELQETEYHSLSQFFNTHRDEKPTLKISNITQSSGKGSWFMTTVDLPPIALLRKFDGEVNQEFSTLILKKIEAIWEKYSPFENTLIKLFSSLHYDSKVHLVDLKMWVSSTEIKNDFQYYEKKVHPLFTFIFEKTIDGFIPDNWTLEWSEYAQSWYIVGTKYGVKNRELKEQISIQESSLPKHPEFPSKTIERDLNFFEI